MSEGIQGNNDRKNPLAVRDLRDDERQPSAQILVATESTVCGHPRPGALLVEAYGKLVVGKPALSVNPTQVLFDCLTFLLNAIGNNTTGETSHDAVALLDTVELSLAGRATSSWDTNFTESVIRVLQTHTGLIHHKLRVEKVLNQLQRRNFSPQGQKVSVMESSRPNDGLSSLITGIADHMSFSDRPSRIAQFFSDLGPSCTRSSSTFREVLTDMSRTNGIINEAAMASLIFFLSDKTSSAVESGTAGLSSALLGSILVGRSSDAPDGGWNLETVAQVIREDYASLDWVAVAKNWDVPEFKIKDTTQFRALLDLYRAGAKNTPPLTAFTSQWRNTAGQLSVIEAMVAVPPSVFMVPLNEEELADAATAPPPGPSSAPNPQCWASTEILQRLLNLSDAPSLYRRVRDLFVRSLLMCPEILFCSLVRLQLQVASAASNHPGGESLVNAGMQIKTELMRELIPLFFRPNAHNRVQNGSGAIRRLYSISPTTVMAACYEAWRSTAHDAAQVRLAEIMHIIQIAKLLPSPADAVASLLSGNKDPEYSIAIAFVMADNEYLQLKPWLGEKLTSKGTMAAFSVALVSYLRKTYAAAKPRGGSGASNASLSSLENIVISLQLLQSLEPALLSQTVSGPDRNLPGSSLGDIIRLLVEVVLATYPSLRGSLVAAQPQVAGTPPPNPAPPQGASSDDVEEMATAYFQKIYTSEQSIGEVVEMLKRFKTSGIAKENEIFACMVHNLFNEYRFFAKYPEKELRITGILFGALIQEQLVSSITLGIALRYVLEALRKLPSPPGTTTSSGKMFKFGMFALEQFKGRLHEWPQYCSHIVQIPHLKEGYAELVAEIEQEMSKNQNRATGSGSSVSSQSSQGNNQVLQVAVQDRPSSTAGPPSQPPVILSPGTPTVEEKRPEFGPKLGRAVSDSSDEELEFDSPTDTMLDKVQFLVNNLAPSNVEQKAGELKDMMEAKYFGWLGHFLVVKRISTQANFHSLYLSFLDCLGEYGKGLVEAILCSVYHNIGKLLRSSKITTSSSERSFLKNLGIFLGQITLARNRPILQIMLDCKELLLQGYETGKLIAVAPFLAKTLEGARNSIIFRPPNPWLMGILGVFRSVYNVQGLKMNIKFEVEVLCKNLGIKLEDIPLRNDVLARRIPPIKERNPDFNIKAAAPSKPVSAAGTEGQAVPLPVPPPTESVGKGHLITPDQLETVIPNLASYVTVNPSLPQLVQSQGGSSLANLITTSSLKRWVPIAVDRAIREIIQPVVERSVTIACITTKEIVVKDFAMESDETKMRKAGQLMVANLAGSLALVTCREPLRSSISSYLRQLLTGNVARSDKLGEQEQNTIEQCVQICSTDNLELGCRLIEKAATEKAIRDIDDALAPAINARRTHREQTGQPYFDTSIFANGSHRYPAALPDQLRPKPGGLRSEHYQLYESFQRMPRAGSNVAGASAAAGTSVTARGPAPTSTKDDVEGPAPKVLAQQFGTEMLTSIVTKLDALVSSLLAAAGSRAVEIKLAMLPQEHQIRQLLSAIKQVIPSAKPAAGVTRSLTVAEQELVLAFSQGIFKRLYELSLLEPLRLEVLVAVLENVNANCPKLGKDIGTWATYAPTNTEAQRRLHKTILLLLVRSRLLSVHELDVFLAARADQGRNHIWVEFSLLFIRTAFMELIATPSEFPKLIELMTRIVEGRSQASQQFIQAYRKPIVRMLEETRAMSGSIDPGGSMNPPTRASEISIEESSSLTKDYLDKLFRAPAVISDATNSFARNDPASSKQQVTALLDSWVRVQTETFGSDKATNQYIQVLQQFGVGKSEEQTERFLRLATLTFVEATLKSSSHAADSSSTVLNYAFIDVYARLLHVIFRRIVMGGNQTQVDALRLGMLNRILGVVIRTMICHHEKWKVDNPSNPWDQRPWYRLLVNLVVDFNKPDPSIDSIRLGILSVFGVAFHCCQPLILPGFSFAWLELVSHRHLLPNMLLLPGQKAWHILHELLMDVLLFLEPYLKNLELSPGIKKLYEGLLRVLLVLLHDFPSFLASYHVSLCNAIPETCIQLRNIILSATPKGISPPDPFTPNLKIDLLRDIARSPAILSNVLGPIETFRGHLDVYLKDGQHRSVLQSLPQLLSKSATSKLDAAKVNSLILYVGAHALARMQSAQISLSHTPEIELIQKLMELDDKGRYICLNAIANQLRYPSSHTHYFSCVMLYLFSESKSVAVNEQITRVLLERLIVNRPHPWGLLITFIELIKNQRYGFWSFPFTRCATEIEKVFESVARSCMPPGAPRSTLVGGEDQ